MKPQRRIRPFTGLRDIISIPQVFILPGALISCALVSAILLEGSLPTRTAFGAGFAALLFGGLSVWLFVIPIYHAFVLSRSAIETSARVVRKEKRPRTLITPDFNMSMTDTVVTFEFLPEGTSSPIQLETFVAKVTSSMQEGKSIKITYARTNPRIVKLPGE